MEYKVRALLYMVIPIFEKLNPGKVMVNFTFAHCSLDIFCQPIRFQNFLFETGFLFRREPVFWLIFLQTYSFPTNHSVKFHGTNPA
jgi:hypothetical protein